MYPVYRLVAETQLMELMVMFSFRMAIRHGLQYNQVNTQARQRSQSSQLLARVNAQLLPELIS